MIHEYIIKYAKVFKHRKYPCKKCLVKVQCQKDFRGDKCPLREDHFKYDTAYKLLKDEISELGLIASLFGGAWFVALTFVFGCWKWVEIVWAYF